MSGIDWSKAPEWADRVVLGSMSNSEYWACDDRRQAIRNDYTYYDNIHLDEQWLVSEWRPSPAWTGEGLPPVGVVCDVEYDTGRELWHEAEVIYHKSDDPRFAAVRLRGTNHDKLVWCSQFRQIRTPEQIATDEREAAIRLMMRAIPGAGSLSRTQAEKLHDAGYRKQEQPK